MKKLWSENLAFLRALLDAVPSMLFVVDGDVTIMHVNSAALQVVGTDEKSTLLRRGGDVLKCVHAAETAAGCGRSPACRHCVIRNSVTDALKGKQVLREPTQMELVTQSGVRDVYFRITAAPFEHGKGRYALLAIEDVTELKKAESALQAGEARLRNITAMLGEGIYALDREGKLTFLNPEAERLLGWTEAELLGKNIHNLIHHQKANGTVITRDECPLYKATSEGRMCREDEGIFWRKDGTSFPVSIVATPMREDGGIMGSVAIFQDITERKRATEELQKLNDLLARQATTDALTGIANRLKFKEALSAELARSRRHHLTFSLIMFDIDHFKQVNDKYGHQAGDCVLREIVALIAGHIRVHDLFARWGGEEFMILVVNTPLDNALLFAEKLRHMVEKFNFPGIGRVTCSFGVAEASANETEDSFTKRVDRAMYRAKTQGRNRVEKTQVDDEHISGSAS